MLYSTQVQFGPVQGRRLRVWVRLWVEASAAVSEIAPAFIVVLSILDWMSLHCALIPCT